MKDKIDEYFEKEKENLLSDLGALIRIPSVRGEASEDAPFGEEPKRALEKMLLFAKRDGFSVRNIDNYAGEISFRGADAKLAMLGHLDVVPEGDGWTVPPYEMTERDGKVYGRGTSDDKGPVIAAMYAMKCVRELGVELKSDVRLIVGTNEETGSADIEYYTAHRDMPPMVFTPDSTFPVTNVERGHFSKHFTSDIIPDDSDCGKVISFKGGFVINAVPNKASAVLSGFSKEELDSAADKAHRETGVDFKLTDNGGSVSILAVGTGAHASLPVLGNNPITALVSLIASLDSESVSVSKFKALSGFFPHGKTRGEGFGVSMSDSASGELTMTLDILNFDGTHFEGAFDSRIPLCATEENLALKVRDQLAEEGFELDSISLTPVHCVDADSDFIKKLLAAYEEESGRKGYCEAIGGGTYVHNIDGGVAFGAIMPEVDTNMHGADEFMPIDDLITAAKIFTKAIISICG
ncbi:MAG: dipeptidase PepV [Acutalibacteraceae bacterium]